MRSIEDRLELLERVARCLLARPTEGTLWPAWNFEKRDLEKELELGLQIATGWEALLDLYDWDQRTTIEELRNPD